MRRVLSSFVLLTVCATPAAQKVFSPSPVYSSREGELADSEFGSYAKARSQLADASLRNRGLQIKSISYRSNYGGPSADGRTWRTVTLSMSETIMNGMTDVATSNVTGTPTQVFSGSMTWPGHTTWASRRPANAWKITVPFARPWSYSGRQDILADYSFDGGVLANKQPWVYRQGGPYRPYGLDAYAYGSSVRSETLGVGNAGINIGCRDSGNLHPDILFGAISSLNFEHHGPSSRFPNQFSAEYAVYYVGRDTPCVTAIGAKLDRAGVALPGVTCNRIHLDFSGLLAMFAEQSSKGWASGGIGPNILTGRAPHYVSPVIPALSGVPFVCQTAWTETKTKATMFTAASLTYFPVLPPWTTYSAVPRTSLHVWSDVQGKVFKSFGRSGYGNPICWYE